MSGPVRRALVLGGSGAVGSAVVRELAGRGALVAYTYWSREPTLPGAGHRVDLSEPAEVRALVARLLAGGFSPDLLVHCAVHSATRKLGELSDAEYERAFAVNVRAPFLAVQALAPAFAAHASSDVVLVGALDRTQALPLPAHFAATQGALSGLVVGLSKELGAQRTRVNLLALGPLSTGLSASLPKRLLEDYQKFSALQRLGTPEEAARAIAWLALENTYVTGKVIPVNGGI